jgi:hypothetical protein
MLSIRHGLAFHVADDRAILRTADTVRRLVANVITIAALAAPVAVLILDRGTLVVILMNGIKGNFGKARLQLWVGACLLPDLRKTASQRLDVLVAVLTNRSERPMVARQRHRQGLPPACHVASRESDTVVRRRFLARDYIILQVRERLVVVLRQSSR